MQTPLRLVGFRTLVLSLAFLILPQSSNARIKGGGGLQCGDLDTLFSIFLKNHYSVSVLSPEIKSRTVAQFIKILDGSKQTLLKEDLDWISAEVPKVFTTMKSGGCEILEGVRERILKRVKENEEYAKVVLDDKYKLDENVEFVIDPEKREPFKSLAEKQTYSTKMIHFQISNLMLGEIKPAEARRQLIHRYELLTKRFQDRDLGDMINMFAGAFATALDPHTAYLAKDHFDDFQIQMGLSLEGIGAALTSDDGYTVVEEIIPGGSADRSKLVRPKDKIIAVQQEGQAPVNAIDMELNDVVKMIRGKKGTKVTLTILRSGKTTERLEISLVRDKINIQDQAAKLTMETIKQGSRKVNVGVIDLPSFYGDGPRGARSCFADIKRLVEEAKAKKAEAIVLNLFRNGGGLLDEAVKMGGLFIKTGGVVATQSTGQAPEILPDRDPEIQFSGPLVILTSRVSASASEILAGAMKDYGRAVIVGSDHTFGKGTVQVLHPLPGDLGAMKVTTGMFFIPKGNTTQHGGVVADIEFPTAYSGEEVGEKTFDYSLEPRKVEPFVSADANSIDPTKAWKPVNPELIKKLASRSQERVSKSSKFKEIKKDLEEFQKNKGVIKLTELRNQSGKKKKKKKDDDKKTAAQRTKDFEAPYVLEAASIAADLVELQYGGPKLSTN